jgi:transposase-like protein
VINIAWPIAPLENGWSDYGSEIYHATKRVSFSSQQKRSITRAIQEGRMTKDEAHLIHEVGKKTLNTWLREAMQEDKELVCFNHDDMAVKQINYSGTELQNELAEARLKIKALEIMIDIAEEQFKIAIRKKSGAKQL